MSEKHLTELPWKALVVKQKIKDPGLAKALVAFGHCDENDNRGKLEALDEIDKHGASLEKEHSKDEVGKYVAEVLKESDKRRKELAQAAKAQAKDEKESAEDEGEDAEAEEYKKDLAKRLISALAQVKSRAPGAPEPGEKDQPQLQFVAYVAGRGSAVLVGKKVGGGSKKLLPSIAGGASGGTYYQGECIFEKSAHTFVLDQVPGGLAKKLSKALFDETGQKYKVRVRSTDGSVELDEDTDSDDPPEPADLAARWKQVKLALYPDIKKTLEGNPANRSQIVQLVGEATKHEKAGNFQSAIDVFTQLRPLLGLAPMQKPAPDLGAKWKEVKIALYPKIKEALAVGSPNRDRIVQLVGEATKFEKAANFQAAIDAFNALRPLLEAPGSKAGGSEQSEQEAEETGASAAGSNLGIWTKAKDQASAQINTLCDFLLKLDWEDELEKEEKASVVAAARRLAAATEQVLVNVKWNASLTSFDQAGAEQRRQLYPELSQTLVEFRTRLSTDPAITAAEDHPMVTVNARKPLLAALDAIQKNLESQLAA